MKDSVAFGRGPHMCVGASLGRLELIVAIEELLAAAPGFTLAGEPVQTRFPEVGALSVPIRFEAAA
jgi:cytochrome P450